MLQSVFLLFPLLISNKLFFQPIKVIYHIHELRNYNRYERFVHKVGIFCASKIIVVSKAVFEKSKQFTNNTKKINLIYNGFNFDLIVSQMNGPTLKNDITGKEFKIGLIGNLVEGKGHLSTLKQFSHEFCLSEKIHFTFLGKYINKDSNYESLLKNKLLEFDNRTLHLTGWVENIYPYYNKFDLILIPTTCELGEAQSNVIIEALSCNSLVLCSNVGGNKEIINEGENGLFFECNNFFEMKDKIMHIKSNYSKFKKIKNNGLDSVKSKFDISRSTTLYEKFIFDTTLF
jgi:glycosyltransferase involved in cell wall biosynthesis